MGNLCSSCCEKSDYTEIVDTNTELTPSQSAQGVPVAAVNSGVDKEGMEFSTVQKDEAHIGTEKFDQNLSPFKGLHVDLKFTSKSSYESKFVWLNSYSNTIHMSQVASKEKRHKEASLADVSVQHDIYAFAVFVLLVIPPSLLLMSSLFFSYYPFFHLGDECHSWSTKQMQRADPRTRVFMSNGQF